MSNFLIIFGLILFFFCFLGFLVCLGIFLPKAEKEGEKWVTFPFLIMGLMFIIGLIAYSTGIAIKNDQPMEVSKACGWVRDYQTIPNFSGRGSRKCEPFERIAIQFKGSSYLRHIRFNEQLERKASGIYACFEFYDRMKYSHLKESRIINWVKS